MTLCYHMADGMRVVRLVMDDHSTRAGVTAAYLNAGSARTAKHWKPSHIAGLRMKGWMSIHMDGRSQIVPVEYMGRGQVKDVLKSVGGCQLFGGVRFVVKVVKAAKFKELQLQAQTWADVSLAGLSPTVYGLEAEVPMHHGTLDSYNFIENVSVLIETYCGEDVGQAFEALVSQPDLVGAIRLRHSAITFWLGWQSRIGHGRVSATNAALRIVKDLHCRNITRCPDNQFGFAIVDTLQIVHVSENFPWGDSHCKAAVAGIFEQWVQMLDRIFQKVPTNPDARAEALSSQVAIKAGRKARDYTLLKEVHAYLELANRVALLLCSALGVSLREPVMAAEAALPVAPMPQPQDVFLPTRRQCAISTMSISS